MNKHFSQVTIVGVGLLGGSMALALKKYNIADRIIGISRPETLKKSKSLGVIDDGVSYEELETGTKNSEIIFVTTPISLIVDLLPRLAQAAGHEGIVTDVGSTKVEIMKTAADLFSRTAYFIGGHPMAGSEQSGVERASADLYKNRPYVIIPVAGIPDAPIRTMEYIIEGIGARPVHLTAEEHDRIVAAISHLPQLASIALMNTIGREDGRTGAYFQLAAGGFRDMTRIASSPYTIWEDICMTNKTNIQRFIQSFIEELQAINAIIGTPELAEKFHSSNKLRELLINKFPFS